MQDLEKVSKLLRYYILVSTTKAQSGHVTSSLSAVELAAVLFYKHFRFNFDNPDFINNDRLIFSKGHASPLYYSLFKCAGKLTEKEILSLREFDSVLEGHPTRRFKYTEAPTGSLGQGLSVGVGMAMSAKMDSMDFLTYVLLGDGEMAEGQVWEAMEIASYYKLNNLVGIIDVNKLGQTGQTLLSGNIEALENRIRSFGFRTYVINDGHNLDEIDRCYKFVLAELAKGDSPYMILARTVKGKGVSFLEGREEWHGKALPPEECQKALQEIGEVDKNLKIEIKKNPNVSQNYTLLKESNKLVHNPRIMDKASKKENYRVGEMVATREGYGKALVELGKLYKDVVVMDGDVSNSTYALLFRKEYPERFFEMFIAEQNMVSCALGISLRKKTPFVSTFAAFFTRAFDQIRMANLAGGHIVFCGSHSGVATGQDGPSQMGLEDIALFRSQLNSVVFCPSDAVSSYLLTKLAYETKNLVYIRTSRPKVSVLYGENEIFEVGGSKTLKSTGNDKVTVAACGVSVFETLKAFEELKKEGIAIRVIDVYSIKPIDREVLKRAAKETKAVVCAEDHNITGGLGDAVLEVLAGKELIPIYKLGVNKIPRSGDPKDLFEYEGISAKNIVKKVKEIVFSLSG